MFRWTALLWTFAALMFTAPAKAAVLYVTPAGDDGQSGANWSAAKKSISGALTAANPGDQVWVAGGTYVGAITLRKDVAVYGGFAGTETDLDQRNIGANPTVLDGGGTVRCVKVNADATPATILDGFQLRNGLSNQANPGGLIFCTGSPTISQCRFDFVLTADSEDFGVLLQGNGSPHFSFCSFSAASLGIEGIAGAPHIDHCFVEGTAISLSSSSLIENCTIENWRGAGLGLDRSISDPNSVHVVRSVLIKNCGTGVNINNGAADLTSCTITGCNFAGINGAPTNLSVSDCTLTGNGTQLNSGSFSGGIHVAANALTVTRCLIQNNGGTGIFAAAGRVGTSTLRITDCLCTGNHSGDNGGGLQTTGMGVIANNTFSDNQGALAGVVLTPPLDNALTFANNLVTFNNAGIAGDGTPVIMSHNDLFGNTGAAYTNIVRGPTDLALDPQFVDRPGGNYRLDATSRGIDSGDDSAVLAGDLDLDLRARLQGLHVDLGAYETPSTLNSDLSVQVAPVPPSVTVGSQVTYTFTVHNAGPSDATDAILLDTLPASLLAVSAASSQGTCVASGNSVSCNLGVIGPGGQATVTVTAQVTATGVGTITNTASVSSSVADSDLTNNAASATTTGVASADLSVTHVVNQASVPVGTPVTYTTTVTNHGPSAASNVTVDVSLPAGVAVNSALSSQGSCTITNGQVHCTLGGLAPNGTGTVSITLTPGASAPATLASTAMVSAAEADPQPANNTATAAPSLQASADLALSGTITPFVQAGGALTYSFTLTNNGPSTATAIAVTSELPGHTTFVSAAPSQGTAQQSNGQVTWSIDTLASGGSATLTVVVQTAADQSLSWSTTGTAASGSDRNSANNTATLTAQRAAADITASVTVKRGPLTFNRARQRWLQKITIKATHKQTLPAPLSLVVGQLSSNAVLKNPSGVTQAVSPLGSPYVNAPAATRPVKSATVTLEFTRADKRPVSYTLKVLGGPGVR